MPEPIADALVLMFTYGVSLRQWRETGMLEREWALYKELLPHYRRLVVVTYGRNDDAQVLEPLLEGWKDKVSVVCNDHGQTPMKYVAGLVERVATELKDCQSVVIKTNQMSGGEVAVGLAEALRGAGKSVGLIARGGYLWTRFVAFEHGPHSKEAVQAAGQERALCVAADAVVGTTGDMVQDLAWRYGLDPTRTTVIPNYVLTEHAPVGPSDREPGFLLYAGQLIARKRVSMLIEAMSLLPAEMKKWARLEIIGDGVERKNLEELAERLGAPVEFVSRVAHRELLEKMRKCTLYVQASELEGHPKTVLEAMTAGAVVVVAEAPGMDVVLHGVTGLRLGPESRQFAHAIAELLGDEEWRQVMGAAAANAARGAYGLAAIKERELDVHRRALGVGQGRVKAVA